jgi:hypothetical protein
MSYDVRRLASDVVDGKAQRDGQISKTILNGINELLRMA